NYGGRRNADGLHDGRDAVKISAGVRHPSVLRGRLLSRSSTARRSAAVWTDRSVRLGKYWRSRPLVFSLVPRCQGLAGWAKKTPPLSSGAIWGWKAISEP